MTITKDHKQGFAVAVVLFLIVYFLFLRKGKASSYTSGGCKSAGCTWHVDSSLPAGGWCACRDGALKSHGKLKQTHKKRVWNGNF